MTVAAVSTILGFILILTGMNLVGLVVLSLQMRGVLVRLRAIEAASGVVPDGVWWTVCNPGGGKSVAMLDAELSAGLRTGQHRPAFQKR